MANYKLFYRLVLSTSAEFCRSVISRIMSLLDQVTLEKSLMSGFTFYFKFAFTGLFTEYHFLMASLTPTGVQRVPVEESKSHKPRVCVVTFTGNLQF